MANLTGAGIRRLLVALAAALVLAGCSSPGMPAEPTTSAPSAAAGSAQSSPHAIPLDALNPTVRAVIEAWNAGDQTAFAAQFSDDATLIDGSREYRGASGIREAASTHVTGYRVRVLEADEPRDDGQKLIVFVTNASGSGGFRASFDFTVARGKVTYTDWQYA
ncbi:MAG: nuclear transport factor 2 family protein [Micropruina sp.]|nr:nuclear transport factor 2 family protein [Micropruina sp.]